MIFSTGVHIIIKLIICYKISYGINGMFPGFLSLSYFFAFTFAAILSVDIITTTVTTIIFTSCIIIAIITIIIIYPAHIFASFLFYTAGINSTKDFTRILI